METRRFTSHHAFFQAVAIHELAHIIRRPALFHDRPLPAADTIRREATNIATRVADDEPEIEKFIPLLAHGPRSCGG